MRRFTILLFPLVLAVGLPPISMQSQAQTVASPAAPTPAAQTTPPFEKLLTPEQSKQLLASVGQMLTYSSQDTGLAIHSKVKGRVTSREAVEKFLNEKLKNDKDAKRMERSELVMKKFGLLDPDFELRPFLISLLKEQIAGYYDDKTKVMNLLNWVDIEDQKPVMAHELTHALQDQRVNLTKWQEASGDDSLPAKDYAEDKLRVATDETGSARDAVLEGQAMIPLIDLTLKTMNQSVRTAPQVIPLMTAQMAQTDPATSPIMARAPLVLQESMLFSYAEGLNFEASLLSKKGPDVAFGGALDHPPSTSAEILHSEQYLEHKKQPLLQMPDVHPLLDPEYAPYDVGVIGEFDIKTLADLFVGSAKSELITPAWQGGTYYAAQRRSDLQSPRSNSAGSIALVYYSEWTTKAAAGKFAEIYQKQFPRKYQHLQVVKPLPDAPPLADAETVYQADGTYALVSVTGNSVFISEGFTEGQARKLQGMFLAGRSQGSVEASLVPRQDLSGSLRSFIANAGMMRCALPRSFPRQDGHQ